MNVVKIHVLVYNKGNQIVTNQQYKMQNGRPHGDPTPRPVHGVCQFESAPVLLDTLRVEAECLKTQPPLHFPLNFVDDVVYCCIWFTHVYAVEELSLIFSASREISTKCA